METRGSRLALSCPFNGTKWSFTRGSKYRCDFTAGRVKYGKTDARSRGLGRDIIAAISSREQSADRFETLLA